MGLVLVSDVQGYGLRGSRRFEVQDLLLPIRRISWEANMMSTMKTGAPDRALFVGEDFMHLEDAQGLSCCKVRFDHKTTSVVKHSGEGFLSKRPSCKSSRGCAYSRLL